MTALRFVGAGLAGGGERGLVLTATGGLATVDGDAAVRQALLLLLSTAPGERLLRPRYGSHLHRLLFAPNDQTTAGLAVHYVREAIAEWEPRVEILSLDAGADDVNPERLVIELRYRVRATTTVDQLSLSVPLTESSPPEVSS